MRLMRRDVAILRMLAEARWLSTSQVKRWYFPDAAIEQVRRRLRILAGARLVRSVREHPMAEAIHTLAPGGKELLAEQGLDVLKLERMPPRYVNHFLGVTDIRLAVKASARREGIEVEFFFGFWELPEVGWRFPMIPDAASGLARRGESITVLFEYDRGLEPLGMLRKKFRRYVRGLDGFPVSHVVTVVDSDKRLEALREDVARHLPDCDYFSFLLRGMLISSWSVEELFA